MTAPGKTRETWIDIARGTAILLVIAFHSGSRLAEQGYAVPAVISSFSDGVAPFRIPMLMFLSGMFLPRSLAKGIVPHLYGKVIHIAWPYALWLLIFCIARGEPGAYLEPITWKGGSYLWYMGFLFAYYLIAIPLRAIPPAVSAVYFYAASIFLPNLDPIEQRFLVLLAYFFLGAQVAEQGPRFTEFLRSRQLFLFIPLLIGTAFAATLIGDFRYEPAALMVTVPCMCVLLAVCIRIQNAPWTAPAAHVGRRSLLYYVIHMPVIVVLQDWLLSRTSMSTTEIVVLSLVAAVSVPAIVDLASRRIPVIDYLFSFPDLRSASSSALSPNR